MITIVLFCASCAFLLQWRLWWYERRCDDHRIDIDETCRRDPYLSQVPKRPHPQQRGRWICLKQDDYWDCGDEDKNQDDNVMYLPELKIRVIIYWQLGHFRKLFTHSQLQVIVIDIIFMMIITMKNMRIRVHRIGG